MWFGYPHKVTDGLSVQSDLGGRYVLGAPLGTGGMADVFRAHDTVLDRPVAVKVFRLDENAAATLARSRNEIALAASLQHHGLVSVFDAGAEEVDGGGRPYLVMELVDGCTLRAAIAARSLSRDDVASVGRQAADALAYLHHRGIVHRDVKPANVLLRRDIEGPPAVKITDFGVARSLNGAPLTETGMTVGTANYLSPEQVAGADVTGSADVYALGLVLLECLTGEVAFPGTGVEAALSRLNRNPLVPMSLGPEWTALLTAMTARDPNARPSAAQVAAALGAPQTTARGLGADDSRHTAVLPFVRVPEERHRVPRGALVLGGMVAAAVAVIVVGIANAGSQTNGIPAPLPATTPAGVAHTVAAAPTTSAPVRVVATHAAPAPPAPPAAHTHHHGKDH